MPVRPRFYYFTILLILRDIGSLHLENPTLHVGPGFYYPEKTPPCLFTFNRISSTGSAVSISKTHLCRSDPDFTILLFYYFTILLFYYFTILLFYYCTILLFYYFTILLFYYFTILLFYYFTILLFYYFTILLFYYFTILLFYYFTILLFYYFTILLVYYFTILLFLREIGSLHLENPPVPVGPRNYRFPDFARNPEKIPPSLFTFNRISSTGSAVCISKTHLCRSDPGFTILLFYYFTILLFYYFTILLFYYFTILLFCYFTNFTGNREFASRKPTCAGWTQKLPLY